MRRQTYPSVVTIEGIDGAGKTETAENTAGMLSNVFPSRSIGVIDSNGIGVFQNGVKTGRSGQFIERLRERPNAPTPIRVASMGGFFAYRRHLEKQGRLQPLDLILSVRDPYRIDPAVYATVFNPNGLGRLGTERRLKIMDSLATVALPQAVIRLEVDPQEAFRNLDGSRSLNDNHETPEKLAKLDDEMDAVTASFNSLFGVDIFPVEALRLDTAGSIASLSERFLEKPAF